MLKSTSNKIMSVLWLNKYIHILQKASLYNENETPFVNHQVDQQQLLQYVIKCALSLTPFLEEELPQLRFSLVSKGEVFVDSQNVDANLRKREMKSIFKLGSTLTSSNIAELKVHVADWKSKDSSFEGGSAGIVESRIPGESDTTLLVNSRPHYKY